MKTKKILFTAIISIAFVSSAQAQNVNIPDATFKAALVANSSINTNMDAEIQVSEASVFNGYIYLPDVIFNLPGGVFITDLTGIEAFVSLISLDCSFHALTSLDVSACTALTYLDCGNNQLTGLNVSTNTVLTNLVCRDNSLTSLNVSANTSLTNLDCRNNSLTSLNISANTALTNLNCGDNYLTSLNVSANTSLTTLHCMLNQLTSLNVSANSALTNLQCGGNILTSLNVSACSALNLLHCHVNQLISLNVSANTALTQCLCSDNQLTSLNVNNGNNNNIVFFGANNNPSLSCIEVDNVQWSIDNWTAAAPQTSFFSENCSGVGITDNNETKAPMFYPNPTTGSIYLPEPANITLSDLSGKLLLEEKNTNQLDISALPTGMYFLSFGENNQHTFKVIKE